MRAVFTIFIAIISLSLFANDSSSPRATYIQTYKDIAMREMRLHGIPASITLAQGILESGDGNSRLAVKANNHFGIKCHGWKGKKIYHDDDAKGECFRSYPDAEQSYTDHSLFLTGRSRYATLFDLEKDDYKGWARGLKKAGYATNPKYAPLLIKIIEENELYIYDRMVLENLSEEDFHPIASKPPVVAYDPSKTAVAISNKLIVQKHPNRLNYVVIGKGVNYSQIEKELNVWDWEIRKYNNLPKSYVPREGDTLFIQPKRNWSRTTKTYTVKPGDSILLISHRQGVKVKSILRKNGLKKGQALKPGTVLYLRGRKPVA